MARIEGPKVCAVQLKCDQVARGDIIFFSEKAIAVWRQLDQFKVQHFRFLSSLTA